VRDALTLNEHERLLGVKAFHDDNRAAETLHGQGHPQRRGVVQRRGVEVHHSFAETVEGTIVCGDLCFSEAGFAGREGELHTLGPTRGSRAVEHHGASLFVLEGVGRVGGRGLLIGVVTRCLAVEHESPHHVRCVRDHRLRPVRQRGRRDEDRGVAVIDDEGRFVRRQVCVDRGDVEAAPEGRPDNLAVTRVVLGHDGEMVSRPEPGLAQETSEPDRAIVQIAVGDRTTAIAHDDGGAFRVTCGDRSRVDHRTRVDARRYGPGTRVLV
jgi:hypothetical protein